MVRLPKRTDSLWVLALVFAIDMRYFLCQNQFLLGLMVFEKQTRDGCKYSLCRMKMEQQFGCYS